QPGLAVEQQLVGEQLIGPLFTESVVQEAVHRHLPLLGSVVDRCSEVSLRMSLVGGKRHHFSSSYRWWMRASPPADVQVMVLSSGPNADKSKRTMALPWPGRVIRNG